MTLTAALCSGALAGSSTSCCHEKTAAEPLLRVPRRRPGARWQHSAAALGTALRFMDADTGRQGTEPPASARPRSAATATAPPPVLRRWGDACERGTLRVVHELALPSSASSGSTRFALLRASESGAASHVPACQAGRVQPSRPHTRGEAASRDGVEAASMVAVVGELDDRSGSTTPPHVRRGAEQQHPASWSRVRTRTRTRTRRVGLTTGPHLFAAA
jgi:hypothetical protein